MRQVAGKALRGEPLDGQETMMASAFMALHWLAERSPDVPWGDGMHAKETGMDFMNMERKTHAAIPARCMEAGYSEGQVRDGLEWADGEGAVYEDEGSMSCMSRILYSDGQLADGERFPV